MGEPTNFDGTNGDYVCIWNGTSFKALGGTELDGEVMTLKFDNHNNLYAGEFSEQRVHQQKILPSIKNGGWVGLTSIGANSTVSAIEIEPNDVYVGGIFTTIGGLSLTDRVAVYRNGAWSMIDVNLAGSDGIYAILQASDGSLNLGGDFSTIAEDPDENAVSGVVALNLNVSSGSANTYPYIQVIGPGTLYSITNYSTGAQIAFNDLTLLQGEVISFNFDPLNLKFTSSWKGRGQRIAICECRSDYGNFYLKPLI